MPTFRCTRKVLDRFRLEPAEELPAPDGQLGDWYVNLLNLGRHRLLLCVSDVSLLPVVMPARKAEFPGRFPAYLNEVLLALGIPEEAAREEAYRGWPSAEGGVRVGKTASRSVLGVMNDFSLLAEHAQDLRGEPLALSLWLANSPSRPIGTSPDRRTRELFGLSGDGTAWRVPKGTSGKDDPPGGEAAPPSGSGPATGASPTESLPFPPKRNAGGAPEVPGFREMIAVVEGTDPPIWRLLQMSEEATLRDLHRVLQVAMAWADVHLHHFEIDGVRYADPDTEARDWGPPTKDSTQTRLLDLGLEKGDRIRYAYDYGDDWHLFLEVADRVAAPEFHQPSWIVAGERAGPPEDCGGIDAFAEILRVLEDPSHPDHENVRGWMGPYFEPARFDPTLANVFLELASGWGALR